MSYRMLSISHYFWQAFNLIDSDNDGAITEDEVKAMTTAELRQFATEVDSANT